MDLLYFAGFRKNRPIRVMANPKTQTQSLCEKNFDPTKESSISANWQTLAVNQNFSPPEAVSCGCLSKLV